MSSNTTYHHLFDADGDLTRETILAYVWGSLSDTDRQLVEQHLAGCEMCRDAVEGIGAMESFGRADDAIDTAQANIDSLVKRRKKRIVPMWLRVGRVAAVLLVLIGAVVGVNRYMLQNNEGIAEFKQERTPDTENKLEMRNASPGAVDSAGQVEVTANGGSGAYTYSWDNVAQTDTVVTGLPSGTYTLTISDGNGNAVTDQLYDAEQNDDAPPLQPKPKQQQTSVPPPGMPVEKENRTMVADEPEPKPEPKPEPQPTVTDGASEDKSPSVAGMTSGAAPTPAPVEDDVELNEVTNADVVTTQSVSKSMDFSVSDNAVGGSTNTAAKYPGGEKKLKKYLEDFEPTASFTRSSGAYIKLKVEILPSGNIGQVSVLQGINDDLDFEAIRYINKMPKWTPAVQGGVPVVDHVELTIPLN